MNALWEIAGQPLAALDATRRTITDAGMAGTVLVYQSLEVGTLTWSTVDGIVPDDQQEITLWRNGVRVFRGTVTDTPNNYDQGIGESDSVTVSDGVWWLANTPVTDDASDSNSSSQTRNSIQFPPGDARDMIIRLINRATAAGLPIRVGFIDTMFLLGRQTFTGGSYLSVLVNLLKGMPDACSYVDYDAPGLPTLNIVRRLNSMPTATLQRGVDEIKGFSLKARRELQVTGVNVVSATRTASGGYVWGQQSAGNPGGARIVSVGGPDIGAFVPPDNLPSATIRTTPVVNTWAAAKLLDSTLAQAIKDNGDLTANPAGGAYSLRQAVAGSTNTATNNITIPQPSIRAADTGAVVTATWNRVLSGEIQDFLKTDYGLQQLSLRVTACYMIQLPGTYLTNVPAVLLALIGANRVSHISGYPPGSTGGDGVTSYFISTDYTVDAISLAYSGVPVYAKALWEYLQPVAGLAQNLYDASNWIPWEGTMQLNPDQPWQRWTARRLNVLNARPALATAGALIQGQTTRLSDGTVSFTVGSPQRVPMSAVIGTYTAPSDKDVIKIL